MTQTYLSFSEDDMKVWNFEFRSLLLVCYLDFEICMFQIRNPRSAIRNFLPHAPCPMPYAGE